MTSAAERACALVGNMLAEGPRDAAEIRAAAEGAKISERTIQRAAITLGVEKSKAGFNRGWTWSLPADDGAAVDSPTAQPASGVLNTDKVPARVEPSRAEVIAARLRKLEAGRGKVAPIYGQDPRVIRWAESGISDPDLREAYELAVYALVRDGSQEPVTAGFLNAFIGQVISEGAKA